MNKERESLSGVNILVKDHVVSAIGKDVGLNDKVDRVVDCSGLVVLPGMINTHHHFYQTLTRNLPACQDVELFDWLLYLYDIWARMTPEALHSGSQIAAAELLATGCTTSVDHAYVYPDNQNHYFDVEVKALEETGIRMYLCRGSMSLSREDGGLPPKCVVQSDDDIMAACEDVVKRYHSSGPLSMMSVVLAPCSPFSVTAELMKETAEYAKKNSLLIHTHLAETCDENAFCIEKVGMRPAEYLRSLGWMTDNAFFAHCVWLNEQEIKMMAETGAGVAHCPTSNMRLGSGIAPIMEMLKAGVNVSVAVDGSASNDSSDMIAEARQAMLLQRVKNGAKAMTGMEALEVATLGGAAVLNRQDSLGSIEVGKAADIIGISLDTLSYAGGQEDPGLAPLFCATKGVDLNIVNGEVVIEKGKFTKLDIERIIANHNEIAHKLVNNL
jgi:cytosine/adenosine deaminase-related metal-dependent hydrolase